MEFKAFSKIARLNRDIVVTEKLDGTNAQVFICNAETLQNSCAGGNADFVQDFVSEYCLAEKDGLYMFAGSRTRWITLGKEKDNAGFAFWVKEHADELFQLGEGGHYGEWYGRGIQRGYGLDHKRFALFNVARWSIDPSLKPKCVELVPLLYVGPFNETKIKEVLADLKLNGSRAVPFLNPEGIVIYHTASKTLYKVTLENDEKPKGAVNES